MPFKYERDDARLRVVITFQGPFQMCEAFAAMDRHQIEDAWSYGVLYDLRQQTASPSLGELRQLMSTDASDTTGDRGPVAFVVIDADKYRIACTYGAMVQSKIKIEVFREMDEAHLWLTAHTAGKDR